MIDQKKLEKNMRNPQGVLKLINRADGERILYIYLSHYIKIELISEDLILYNPQEQRTVIHGSDWFLKEF